MDKVTLEAVMEEIKKSLGEARLMKIFEDDPEDKVIKQEPKTSATPSGQEDQDKTGSAPATAGSQPQSTMASVADRVAFDKRTGADQTRSDAAAADFAKNNMRPLAPGGPTTPPAAGTARPLPAPSAPMKPIIGPTTPAAGAKPSATELMKSYVSTNQSKLNSAAAEQDPSMKKDFTKNSTTGAPSAVSSGRGSGEAEMAQRKQDAQVAAGGGRGSGAAEVAKRTADAAKPSSPGGGFSAAFAAARKEQGAGGTFTYQGKTFSTNRADDKSTAPKPAAPMAPRRPMVAENFDQFIKKFLKESK
jgi:hypothetical protein